MIADDELHTLCRYLGGVATSNIENLPGYYGAIGPKVRAAIARFPGVKTDILAVPAEDARMQLRVATILADITSVFFEPRGTMVACVSANPEGSGLLEFDEEKATIAPAYATPVGDDINAFVNEVQPLMEAGRVMVVPIPVLSFRITERDENRAPKAVSIGFHLRAPAHAWCRAPDEFLKSGTPLRAISDSENVRSESISFMVPYLDGLPFSMLAKVLDDEQDCLATFRAAIKQVVNETQAHGNSTADLFNDVVRPATETINRQFNKLKSFHSLKMGGISIGTVGLSLLTISGYGPYMTPVIAAAGIAALGSAFAEYRKDRQLPKDSPYYLLWKLQRQSR